MSVLMSVPTTDPFGISSTFPEKVRRLAPSTVNVTLLDDTIQAVLEQWDEIREAPLGRYSDVPHEHVIGRTYPQTPIEAVDYIRDALQVPRDAVFPAVGVPERTFHNWKKKPDTRPRQESVAKLWAMTDALFHLQAVHANIAAWYHATPAAQAAFSVGDVNRLLQLELQYVNAKATSLTTSGIPAPRFGDPGDLVGHADASDAASEGAAPSMAAPRIRTARRRRINLPSAPASRRATGGTDEGR